MKFCYFFKLIKAFCLLPCYGPRSIIELAAFQPPPPSYSINEPTPGEYQMRVNFMHHLTYTTLLFSRPRKVKVHFATTKSNNNIVCYYYRVKPKTKSTILYSQCNASDLGYMLPVCVWIAKCLHCNIFAYDYSGYGRSSGKPSEKRIYEDIEAAFNLLLHKFNCSPEDVILFGRSLGSAPTIHLASKTNVKGVVIQSGFTSALNLVFPRDQPKTMGNDAFENFKRIEKVCSPTLVIHGMKDEIIDVKQGFMIYERCNSAVTPLWLDNANHNDIETFAEFMDRLKKFVKHDLTVKTCRGSATKKYAGDVTEMY